MENATVCAGKEMTKAMSYNVYIGKQTEERHGNVAEMIRNYSPDLLGVQETDIKWMRYLSEAFPEYSYVGEGRDGGEKGEYSAIFYRKDKYKVIDSATKWLSDTPDVVSKVPESSLNRVFSYALLERISDGKKFVHVNTHFEHRNDISREKQAEVLAAALRKFDLPVLLTGDFNTQAGTKAFSTVVNAGVTDSMAIAEKVESVGTFHGYENINSTIDFCFVTADKISVSKYRVCDDKIGGDYPSDHHPVYIEITL